MKRKSQLVLMMAILCINLGVIAQSAVAVKKDPYAGYDHRIAIWDESSWVFKEDTACFIAYGWVISQEEFDAGMRVPGKMYFYIDGAEIETKRFAEKIRDEPTHHSPIFQFYALFDPCYFGVGEHEVRIICRTAQEIYVEFTHQIYVLDAVPLPM